ncbi:MAG: response regulator [Verrucomicrobiae bacterium]|nr:response regulator [Verrucomicrobiae bacterium]MCX7723111.1 response regulator [Verrucomicrobiae bacterium]MDW7981057.1 response regulator [Verrucomicrobiales bacterium]
MSKVTRRSVAGGVQKPKSAKPLIYVVDDEPMLLQLACLILTPLGLQVETFHDPSEALERFAKAARKPEVVITDYAMHKVNGLELVARCKEIHPAQKVILVSGTVGPEVIATAPVQPDIFLAKPYEVEQLRKAVLDLLPKTPNGSAKKPGPTRK